MIDLTDLGPIPSLLVLPRDEVAIDKALGELVALNASGQPLEWWQKVVTV